MDWRDSLKYPLVYVEWEDPTSIDEWIHSREIRYEPNRIRTCGFLIKENDVCLVLALNLDDGEHEESVSCCMIIPKSVIKRQFKLFSD